MQLAQIEGREVDPVGRPDLIAGRAFRDAETRSSSGLPIVKIAELNRLVPNIPDKTEAGIALVAAPILVLGDLDLQALFSHLE